MKPLKSLVLDKIENILPELVKSIFASELSSLEELSLSFAHLRDLGLSLISEDLSKSRLQSLSLCSNRISPEGASVIASLI